MDIITPRDLQLPMKASPPDIPWGMVTGHCVYSAISWNDRSGTNVCLAIDQLANGVKYAQIVRSQSPEISSDSLFDTKKVTMIGDQRKVHIDDKWQNVDLGNGWFLYGMMGTLPSENKGKGALTCVIEKSIDTDTLHTTASYKVDPYTREFNGDFTYTCPQFRVTIHAETPYNSVEQSFDRRLLYTVSLRTTNNDQIDMLYNIDGVLTTVQVSSKDLLDQVGKPIGSLAGMEVQREYMSPTSEDQRGIMKLSLEEAMNNDEYASVIKDAFGEITGPPIIDGASTLRELFRNMDAPIVMRPDTLIIYLNINRPKIISGQ